MPLCCMLFFLLENPPKNDDHVLFLPSQSNESREYESFFEGGISYARTLQAIVVSSSTESIWDYSVGVGMRVVVLKLALMKPMGLQ